MCGIKRNVILMTEHYEFSITLEFAVNEVVVIMVFFYTVAEKQCRRDTNLWLEFVAEE